MTDTIQIEGRAYRLLGDAEVVDEIHDRHANGDRVMPDRWDMPSANSKQPPFHKVYRRADLPVYVPVS